MSFYKKRHFWWRCRIYFRRFRIAVWLVLLALICALIYLDQVGLPDFIKRPVLEQLRARGVDLQFSRLRLQWHHGFVAEDVRFGQTGEASLPRPQLLAKQVSLQINPWELAKLRLQVDGLELNEGRVEWPADETDASLRSLNVENIHAVLQLRPGDEWSLEDFRARFAGADFLLLARITNASAVRDWPILHSTKPGSTNAWPRRLHLLAGYVQRFSFSTPPKLRLAFGADARDPQSVNARFTLGATDVATPWGNATNFSLVLQILPGDTNGACRAQLHLGAEAIQTRWGHTEKVRASTHVAVLTNPPPFDESLVWWTNAMPWKLDWNFEAANLHTEKIQAGRIACAGRWLAPELAITNLHGSVGGGVVSAGARLDVLSRSLQFRINSDADPRSVEQFLTPKTRLWMTRFSWASSPRVNGNGAVILPAWTNRSPDWRGEVQPTLCLAGEFAATNGTYLGIPADSATAHFTYTNLVWNLPDMNVRGPGGALRLAVNEDDRTKDYHWHIKGTVDPNTFRPLLSTNLLRGFDLVSLPEPIALDGDIWGRLYEYDRIGLKMHVAVTNFSFRGQSADAFESDVHYTNRVIELIDPHLTRGAQHMNASGLCVDFDAERMYFTNGFAMADPQTALKTIGPKVAHTMEPYRFGIPPVVHVQGYAPLKGTTNVDLLFSVDGGPFEWARFKVPHIAGNVHWKGKTLLLTNVQADFYEGGASGNAVFNFEPESPGCDYNFSLAVSNANLHLLMADLSTKSNRLEGYVSGSMLISDANSTNWHTWNGLGTVRLRDGFVWEIPVFGVLSPMLDSIIPGLGNSPATEGRAGFVITNGVIYSDSLNIRSPLMRLKYDGTIDFNGQINQRVEAELFRDSGFFARLIGAAFTPVTKLFEYKVTGTLSKPKLEPLYFLPKLILMPLHPIRTLEGLFQGEDKSIGSANAPTDNANPFFGNPPNAVTEGETNTVPADVKP